MFRKFVKKLMKERVWIEEEELASSLGRVEGWKISKDNGYVSLYRVIGNCEYFEDTFDTVEDAKKFVEETDCDNYIKVSNEESLKKVFDKLFHNEIFSWN